MTDPAPFPTGVPGPTDFQPSVTVLVREFLAQMTDDDGQWSAACPRPANQGEAVTFTRAWLADAGERVVRAFLVAFLGVLLASKTGIYDLSALHAAAGAGLASALSLVLSLLGAKSGSAVSPASLAPAPKRKEAQ